MPPDPHWTAYLTALLTPTVAILGALIAFRQWKLAQNKLKLDLFDRRFKVYEAARKFLSSIVTNGEITDEALHKFMYGTREAEWVLSQAVADYIDKQLYPKAIDLQCLASELVGLGVGEERSTNVRNQAELKKWLVAQIEVLNLKFSPFLQLQH